MRLICRDYFPIIVHFYAEFYQLTIKVKLLFFTPRKKNHTIRLWTDGVGKLIQGIAEFHLEVICVVTAGMRSPIYV